MNWDAFLMGISDFGLERLKEERQAKMQKDLLELQQKYARESAEFTQKLRDKSDAKRVSGTIETEDGKMRDVNVFGEQIGEDRELSPFARREREMAEEKHESDIDYRNRQLDIQQQQVNAIRERTAAARAGSEIALDIPGVDPTNLDRALDLISDLGLSPPSNSASNDDKQAWVRSYVTPALGVLDDGVGKNWRREELQRELIKRLDTVGGAKPTGP